MPTYIILGNFTDQGIRNIKDSPKRETAFRNLCEKAGAQVKDTYRTMGRYDLAAIVDAPDDVTLNAIVYSLGSLGNVRTETLRAFTRQETEADVAERSEEHTSELQSRFDLVCRLLLEKKKQNTTTADNDLISFLETGIGVHKFTCMVVLHLHDHLSPDV